MKMITKRATLCVVIAAMFATVYTVDATRAQEGGGGASKENNTGTESDDRSDWAVQNEKQAIANAREIIGVPDRDTPGVRAKLVTPVEDKTPFLHEKIVGRSIWTVAITKGRLRLPSAGPGEEDSYERVFDVFVDPENGNLLKIISRWPKGAPRVAAEPSPDSAERQMKNAGLEKYHDFPQAKPLISFLEALDVVLKDGGVGSPLSAKQISAHYVMRSAMGRKPKPVWAITLRGIPPFKAAYPGVPVDARNHIRHIVDARTGEWICAGTTPQPEAPKDQASKTMDP